MKILFNIRFIYGDLSHRVLRQLCPRRFTISCCASFFYRIKSCLNRKKTPIRL
ncbi:hypothetical protein HMPREF1502_4577 [Klebsiella sp. AS10]|nr:hypothetical protein HMPREF1502_4577 [Klebsiella sp. AS10]